MKKNGLKFEIVRPREDEEYEVAYDDYCLVVKVPHSNQKVWISKSMAKWIALNFADLKEQNWEEKLEVKFNEWWHECVYNPETKKLNLNYDVMEKRIRNFIREIINQLKNEKFNRTEKTNEQ